VDLQPDLEARAVRAAEARGVPVEDFLKSLLERALMVADTTPAALTLEEFDRLMDELAEGSEDLPAPVVLSRAEIYQDHD
jgi:hypothetical protein